MQMPSCSAAKTVGKKNQLQRTVGMMTSTEGILNSHGCYMHGIDVDSAAFACCVLSHSHKRLGPLVSICLSYIC